jgi:hypothetical protein
MIQDLIHVILLAVFWFACLRLGKFLDEVAK